MRPLFFLILFAGFLKSFSQVKLPTENLKVDSSYSFIIVISLNKDNYQYKYTTKFDTLKILKFVNKKNSTESIKATSGINTIFINKLLNAVESLKIDTIHKPVRSAYRVFLMVKHNSYVKTLHIQDTYYLNPIFHILKEFNSNLVDKSKFPLVPSLEDNNGAFIITDTTFSAEIDHSLNMDHKKDKLFTSKFDQQPVVEISYFDTINNAKKNKQLLKIKSEQIKTLQSKSIGFLNSMSLKNNKFIKNADMLDAFFMSYSVPGLLVTSEIYSLESIKQDKKITDFITYLNSSLGSKYTFD